MPSKLMSTHRTRKRGNSFAITLPSPKRLAERACSSLRHYCEDIAGRTNSRGLTGQPPLVQPLEGPEQGQCAGFLTEIERIRIVDILWLGAYATQEVDPVGALQGGRKVRQALRLAGFILACEELRLPGLIREENPLDAGSRVVRSKGIGERHALLRKDNQHVLRFRLEAFVLASRQRRSLPPGCV
jgi:hypothetical protein